MIKNTTPYVGKIKLKFEENTLSIPENQKLNKNSFGFRIHKNWFQESYRLEHQRDG